MSASYVGRWSMNTSHIGDTPARVAITRRTPTEQVECGDRAAASHSGTSGPLNHTPEGSPMHDLLGQSTPPHAATDNREAH